ncbi:28888_t:CDS:1, partial [Racocetra persica]
DENSEAHQSRKRSENNKKGCWRYFEPFKVPKSGTKTRCTIAGCNTEYTWRGSTFNHVRHLKNKHNITKSPTSIQSNESSLP